MIKIEYGKSVVISKPPDRFDSSPLFPSPLMGEDKGGGGKYWESVDLCIGD
jgi:hypothetical protein